MDADHDLPCGAFRRPQHAAASDVVARRPRRAEHQRQDRSLDCERARVARKVDRPAQRRWRCALLARAAHHVRLAVTLSKHTKVVSATQGPCPPAWALTDGSSAQLSSVQFGSVQFSLAHSVNQVRMFSRESSPACARTGTRDPRPRCDAFEWRSPAARTRSSAPWRPPALARPRSYPASASPPASCP